AGKEAAPRGRGRRLGRSRLQIGDPRLSALQGMLLDQDGLGEEIEGEGLLPAKLVDQGLGFRVDIACRRRLQTLEQAEDEVAFLRGQGVGPPAEPVGSLLARGLALPALRSSAAGGRNCYSRGSPSLG